MADQVTTPEPVTPPTASGAAGTDDQQVNWKSEAEAYKKRFAGLQSTYQKTHDELEALKAAKFDIEQKFTATTGEYEAQKLEWKKAQEGHSATAAELATLKTAHDRMQLIVAEFPALVEYEAKGLLPAGQGEDFKAKLGTFASLLKAQGAAAAKDLVSGATPPAPASGGPRSAKDILMEANRALREGNMELYDKLYSEFVKAKA